MELQAFVASVHFGNASFFRLAFLKRKLNICPNVKKQEQI